MNAISVGRKAERLCVKIDRRLVVAGKKPHGVETKPFFHLSLLSFAILSFLCQISERGWIVARDCAKFLASRHLAAVRAGVKAPAESALAYGAGRCHR